MTRNDDGEPFELAQHGFLRLRRDVLISALTEVLEKHPDLLIAAIENIQSQQVPDSRPITEVPSWPADAAAFASLLRERRTAAGLTRAQLSIHSGVAPATIRNIEWKRHRPTASTRRLIMRAFERPFECDRSGSRGV